MQAFHFALDSDSVLNARRLRLRFILLISDFIVEGRNVLANNAAKAAEKISQFKITIFRSLCGPRLGLLDVKLTNVPLSRSHDAEESTGTLMRGRG